MRHMRYMSDEKTLFVSLVIPQFILMFTEASKSPFNTKGRCKVVTSRQVEFPFHRDEGRQRGKGICALAQVFGRTAIPILRNFVVLSTKVMGADLLKLLYLKMQRLLVEEITFKTAPKCMEGQTLKKSLGSYSKKKTANRVILPKICKRNPSVVWKYFFFQKFSTNILKQNSVANICVNFCKPWPKHSKTRIFINSCPLCFCDVTNFQNI